MTDQFTSVIEFKGFRLDQQKRVLKGPDGGNIAIPSKAFDTLVFLVNHAGEIVEKEQLLIAVWADTFVEENNLNQHISILRKVFGERRNDNEFIATIPGRGYKFVADVRRIDEVASGEDDPVKAAHTEAHEGPAISGQARRGIYTRMAVSALGIIAVIGVAIYLWKQNSDPAMSGKAIRTLAVLPFKPLGTDNTDDELQLGMADSLIAKLSSGSDVVVRPLGTVRRFGSADQDPVAAGTEIGVEAVLDGTIQTANNRIRISARLISVSDGRQLWAGQFDEEFTDIFSVQDSITERVASVLKADLAKRKFSDTKSVDAYRLYIKGRYHILKITRPETEKAIAYFRKAIDADPNYALAYTGLADAYRLLSLSGEMPPAEVLPKAKAAAQKAIELDETLADSHALLGFITFWYEWNWSQAENQFKRAIELGPNNADAHIFYANLLSNLGRHPEALAEAAKAVELDPLNLRTAALRAQFLLHAGKTDEALVELHSTFEMDPNYWLAHLYSASAYIEKADYERAIKEAESARGVYESARSASFLGFALARAGRKKEALDEVDRLIGLSETGYVSPYNIALIYAGLNDRDNAVRWLKKGFEIRDPRMTFLKVEPKWNNLREDPGFAELIDSVGLS